MTIEEQLKELIIKKHSSVLRFTQKFDIPYSTMTSLFSRGVNKTNINTIIKVCQALNISADELAAGRITPVQYFDVNVEYVDLSKLTEENRARLKDYYDMLLKLQDGE